MPFSYESRGNECGEWSCWVTAGFTKGTEWDARKKFRCRENLKAKAWRWGNRGEWIVVMNCFPGIGNSASFFLVGVQSCPTRYASETASKQRAKYAEIGKSKAISLALLCFPFKERARNWPTGWRGKSFRNTSICIFVNIGSLLARNPYNTYLLLWCRCFQW